MPLGKCVDMIKQMAKTADNVELMTKPIQAVRLDYFTT
jgi:hypothetical protein